MTKADEARLDAKRKAIVVRLREAEGNLGILARMWDERTLDALILALGLGRVELEN